MRDRRRGVRPAAHGPGDEPSFGHALAAVLGPGRPARRGVAGRARRLPPRAPPALADGAPRQSPG